MQNKKSFVLYADSKELFEALSDVQAGKLIKHILRYVNDENPTTDDPIVNISFIPIKQALKRDLEKWQGIKQKRSEAGKLGGRPKAKKANALIEKQTEAKKAVSVNDNVNVTVNVTDNVNVINKEKEFKNSLIPFLGKYDTELLEEFFLYWSEKNDGGKKMRFEYQKNQPFNTSRRLATWAKRKEEFKKEKSSGKKEKTTLQDRVEQSFEIKEMYKNRRNDTNS